MSILNVGQMDKQKRLRTKGRAMRVTTRIHLPMSCRPSIIPDVKVSPCQKKEITDTLTFYYVTTA